MMESCVGTVLAESANEGICIILLEQSQTHNLINWVNEQRATNDDPYRFTYEIAPVFVLMEEEVLNNLAIHVGWHSFDGILSPGGSINNLYAVMIARQRACPGANTYLT